MIACKLGNKEAIKLLITIGGANYHIKTKTGTPLVMAVDSGDPQVVEILLSFTESSDLN